MSVAFVDWFEAHEAEVQRLVRNTCHSLLDQLPGVDSVIEAKREANTYKLLMITQQLIRELDCPLPHFDMLTTFAFRYLRQGDLPKHTHKAYPEIFGMRWVTDAHSENLTNPGALVLSAKAIADFERAILPHPQVRLALQMAFLALIHQIEHKVWVEDRIVAHVRRHNPHQDYEVRKITWEPVTFLSNGGLAIPCSIEGALVSVHTPERILPAFSSLINTELARLIAWAEGTPFDPFPDDVLASHRLIPAYRDLPATTQQTLLAAWRATCS